MNIVLKAVRSATGMRMKDFVREKLGLVYETYRYRVRSNCLHLEDYHKLCFYTGLTFEELFPSPYVPEVKPKRLQRINLSVGKDVAKRQVSALRRADPPKVVQVPELKTPVPDPPIIQEKEKKKKDKKNDAGQLPDVNNVYGSYDIGQISLF
jgi:hypothetical protein